MASSAEGLTLSTLPINGNTFPFHFRSEPVQMPPGPVPGSGGQHPQPCQPCSCHLCATVPPGRSLPASSVPQPDRILLVLHPWWKTCQRDVSPSSDPQLHWSDIRYSEIYSLVANTTTDSPKSSPNLPEGLKISQKVFSWVEFGDSKGHKSFILIYIC